jgi:1-deoxy-D-xylulose-5-phosphate synthase
MDKLLDSIHGPADIKNLTAEQLNQLADQIRQMITQSVSRTGGHLASNLGVVDLQRQAALGCRASVLCA